MSEALTFALAAAAGSAVSVAAFKAAFASSAAEAASVTRFGSVSSRALALANLRKAL